MRFINRLWTIPVCLLLLDIATQFANSMGKEKVAMTHNLSSRSNFNQTEQEQNVTEGRSVVLTSAWENEDECGVITAKVTGTRARILGGQTATRGHWPWMAMLWRYYTQTNSFTFTCGGSVVKKQWVLTASHCFNREPIEYTQVLLGAHRLDLKDSTAKRFAIASYICHNLYIGPLDTFKHDVCLVKLAGEVEYTDFIKPICLPTITQALKDGESCKIAGWGDTKGTGDNSELQVATVEVLNRELCDKWYEEYALLPEDHFCAGRTEGKVDSCQGDSGGPLTAVRTVGKATATYQFGIVSFGIGCGMAQLPGVYTKVLSYTDWVASAIKQYSGPETCFDSKHLVACGSSITESGTTIRTPVENQRTWIYPANMDCSWNIVAPEGCAIHLKFNCFFHTEINAKNTSQCYDYMRISSAGAGISHVYCKPWLPNNVRIGSNRVTVSFHSDESVQSSGFVFQVMFLQPRIVIGEKTTSTNETTVFDNSTKHENISGITENGQIPVKVSTKECVTNCNSGEAFSNYPISVWIFITLHLILHYLL